MDASRNSGNGRGRRLLMHEVSEGIKRYILDNGLRPGDLLPTENELCEALDASRSSVREAVKTLDVLDIVEVRRGHGTYVGRLGLSALVESLTFRGLLDRDDDMQLMLELADMRELFERGMADRIVAALDAAEVETLDTLVDDMEASGSGDGTGFVEADRAFHALLVAPLGNELIGQLSAAFWDVYIIVAPHLNGISRADEVETVHHHRRIVEAARARDAAAFAAAVSDHYAPVRRRIADARSAGPQDDGAGAEAGPDAGTGAAAGAGTRAGKRGKGGDGGRSAGRETAVIAPRRVGRRLDAAGDSA